MFLTQHARLLDKFRGSAQREYLTEDYGSVWEHIKALRDGSEKEIHIGWIANNPISEFPAGTQLTLPLHHGHSLVTGPSRSGKSRTGASNILLQQIQLCARAMRSKKPEEQFNIWLLLGKHEPYQIKSAIAAAVAAGLRVRLYSNSQSAQTCIFNPWEQSLNDELFEATGSELFATSTGLAHDVGVYAQGHFTFRNLLMLLRIRRKLQATSFADKEVLQVVHDPEFARRRLGITAEEYSHSQHALGTIARFAEDPSLTPSSSNYKDHGLADDVYENRLDILQATKEPFQLIVGDFSGSSDVASRLIATLVLTYLVCSSDEQLKAFTYDGAPKPVLQKVITDDVSILPSNLERFFSKSLAAGVSIQSIAQSISQLPPDVRDSLTGQTTFWWDFGNSEDEYMVNRLINMSQVIEEANCTFDIDGAPKDFRLQERPAITNEQIATVAASHDLSFFRLRSAGHWASGLTHILHSPSVFTREQFEEVENMPLVELPGTFRPRDHRFVTNELLEQIEVERDADRRSASGTRRQREQDAERSRDFRDAALLEQIDKQAKRQEKRDEALLKLIGDIATQVRGGQPNQTEKNAEAKNGSAKKDGRRKKSTAKSKPATKDKAPTPAHEKERSKSQRLLPLEERSMFSVKKDAEEQK